MIFEVFEQISSGIMNYLSVSEPIGCGCDKFVSNFLFRAGPETEHKFPFNCWIFRCFSAGRDIIRNSLAIFFFGFFDKSLH